MEQAWDWTRPREVLERWPGCKTSTLSWRPILARIRRRFVQLGERFEEKRQARHGSSAPQQSGLAQETRSTSSREKTEHVGMLRGGAGTSGQSQVEASQLGACLRELGRPESSLIFFTAPSSNSHTLSKVRHSDRPRTNIENGCVGFWRTRIADTPTFKRDEELLPMCIKKLKKHKNFAYGGHSRDFLATQLTSTHTTRTARTVHHGHVHITGLRDTVDNQSQRA